MQIGVLGGGALGGAIVRGLTAARADVLPDAELWLAEPDATKHPGAPVQSVTDAQALPRALSLVIVAVKPPLVEAVCQKLQPLAPEVVVSVAAGVSLQALRQALGAGPTLFRAMATTAAASRQTTTTLLSETSNPPPWVERVFQALGTVVPIAEERLMDGAMAVSASAPAYFLAAAEGLADGGVRLGLSRALAETLALGALRSAFAVGAADGMTTAKYRITSPGGTTIEGLAVLERAAVKAAFSDAAVASAKRAQELLGSKK